MSQKEPIYSPEGKGISANDKPEVTAIHEQLERIVADPLFHSSRRFTSLLRFIVTRTVEGQHDCLKERIIGIEIFGRIPDYDTSTDATVRVAVNELRKRLNSYYQNPIHQNELRIELPTRSYVAEFKSVEQFQVETPRSKQLRNKRGLKIWILVSVTVLILLSGAWETYRRIAEASPIERFWSPIVKSPAHVMIALGALQTQGQPVPLSTPTQPGSSGSLSLEDTIAQIPSFPFNDVSAATSVSSFLGQRGKESETRVAQSMMPTELRAAPLVLIGGIRNDWAMRLGLNLRYKLMHDHAGSVHWIGDSTKPAERSWSVDVRAPLESNQVVLDYALINRVLDPGTGQWWIGFSGLTGIATLAAEQVVVDSKTMAALAEDLPKGWEKKNLQIVLEVKILKGSPGASRAVAVYSW